MSILKTYDVFKTEDAVNARYRFPAEVTKEQKAAYDKAWKSFWDAWHKRLSQLVIELGKKQ